MKTQKILLRALLATFMTSSAFAAKMPVKADSHSTIPAGSKFVVESSILVPANEREVGLSVGGCRLMMKSAEKFERMLRAGRELTVEKIALDGSSLKLQLNDGRDGDSQAIECSVAKGSDPVIIAQKLSSSLRLVLPEQMAKPAATPVWEAPVTDADLDDPYLDI